jgi:hypothetical protein
MTITAPGATPRKTTRRYLKRGCIERNMRASGGVGKLEGLAPLPRSNSIVPFLLDLPPYPATIIPSTKTDSARTCWTSHGAPCGRTSYGIIEIFLFRPAQRCERPYPFGRVPSFMLGSRR